MKLHRVVKAILAAALVAVCFSGCSSRFKVMNITVPEYPEPDAGEIVMIVEVTDERMLEDFQGIFTFDPSLEWRAFAPIWFGYLVLPEGRTVTDVVEEAVVQGLRSAGYRVVREGDPRSAEAIPLKVRIIDFWMYKTESGKGAGTYFSSNITVSGPLEPFDNSLRIITEARDSPDSHKTLWLVRLDTFEGAMKQGMKQLVEDVAREAAPPFAPLLPLSQTGTGS